jgi:hypothetical protein
MSTLSLPTIHNVASDLSDPDGLDGRDHPSGFMRMEWIASQNSVRSGLVPSLLAMIAEIYSCISFAFISSRAFSTTSNLVEMFSNGLALLALLADVLFHHLNDV